MTPEGLRVDGRRAGEIRKINCQMGTCSHGDGSSTFQMGNTLVVATVNGPKESAYKSRAEHDRAIITCEFSMSSFSTTDRMERRPRDRQSVEVASTVQQIMESTVLVSLFSKSQIDIHLQVIEADSGVVAACINATTLALIDAGIPMKDYVCACGVSQIDDSILLDTNSTELVWGCAELTIAYLPRTEEISALQLENRLPLSGYEELVKLGVEGCKQMYNEMESEVQQHMRQRLRSKLR